MRLRSSREATVGWTFLSPALLHLGVFALFPIVFAGYVSLFKWNLLRDHHQWVGLGNYAFAMREAPFWNAMWNSLRFMAMSVPLGIALALGVALLVNQPLKGSTIFRTIFYIPAISSGVATAILWIYIFLPQNGLINLGLGAIGMSNKTDFLNDIRFAMPALVLMSAFTGLGPRMILFLAGLIGIHPSLYEAAELDGAGSWATFWKVTLPLLAPTTLFVLVTSTISAMQLFTPVYMMTKGGPEDSTDVVGYHIYTEAWINFNTGLAGAKSFLLLLVIAAVSYIQYRMTKAGMEGYSAG